MEDLAKSNRTTLTKLLVVATGMFGFGFALVPIYKKICEIAGVYSVEARADVVNTQVDASRVITVEFDANSQGLPFEFRPLERSVRIHPGQMTQIEYEVRHRGATPIVAQAIMSSGPTVASRHLKKIDCFCFSRQEFQPGEVRRLPVQFVLDSALPGDVATVTLSYTFLELPAARAAVSSPNPG